MKDEGDTEVSIGRETLRSEYIPKMIKNIL